MQRWRGLGVAVLTAVFLLGPVAWVSAELRVASIISDGMVLQRNKPVKIWGWARPDARIRVRIGDTDMETVTAPSGRWQATLFEMPAGGPHTLRISGDGGNITVKDVLFGEVWVCSGQSNMQWSVAQSKDPEFEIENANYPAIRMFSVKRESAADPAVDCTGTWEAATPENVGEFSAVGYYFARQLHQTLGVPVGMLHSSWGGTPVESWISEDTLEPMPDGPFLMQRHLNTLAAYEERLAAFEEDIKAWNAAKASGDAGDEPLKPNIPVYARDSWRPSGLYNAMIAPLTSYTIRGAIWYQGESNAGRAYQYRTLFPALIRDWRLRWNQNQFPFYFVQLANWEAGDDPTWPELREAQEMALRMQNTGMAVTIDIGNPDDIHPKNKQEVGRRLALHAMAGVYGVRVYQSGPVYTEMRVEGDTIRVGFANAWKGLEAKGGTLSSFEIAGEDRKFYPAVARIEEDTVVVRSDAVPKPVAVRYAWQNSPVASLFNGTGLPAAPFRTDDWPGITEGAR